MGRPFTEQSLQAGDEGPPVPLLALLRSGGRWGRNSSKALLLLLLYLLLLLLLLLLEMLPLESLNLPVLEMFLLSLEGLGPEGGSPLLFCLSLVLLELLKLLLQQQEAAAEGRSQLLSWLLVFTYEVAQHRRKRHQRILP